MKGINLIVKERKRQIEKEGFGPRHDAGHCNGELALAAACSWKPRDSTICPPKLVTAIKSMIAASAGHGHTAGEG